jgi:hypothetical protein
MIEITKTIEYTSKPRKIQMIRQRDTFSASEFFYAINFDSLRVNGSSSSVDAIWFKRKSGERAVCMGKLGSYGAGSQNPADFMRNFDGRYGGNTKYKWNGTEMWSDDNIFVDMIEAHKILDPILKNFPNIPEGYTGWYAIK